MGHFGGTGALGRTSETPVAVLKVRVEWHLRSPEALTEPLWAAGGAVTTVFFICTALLDKFGQCC